MNERMTSGCCLELYVCPDSLTSSPALDHLAALCMHDLGGDCVVRVIDISKRRRAAEAAAISDTPTLLKRFPAPPRRVVGDLSDRRHVLEALDLPPALPRGSSFAPEPASKVRPAIAQHRAAAHETSPSGTLVVDAFGAVVFASPGAELMLQQRREQLLGNFIKLQPLAERTASVLLRVGVRNVEATVMPIEWEGGPSQLVTLRELQGHAQLGARESTPVRERLIASDRGLVLNCRALQQMLSEEGPLAGRSGSPTSALLLECEGVEDSGVDIDLTQRALSAISALHLRPGDAIGRIDDFRFLVLLSNTEPAAAANVGARLMQELGRRLSGQSTLGVNLRTGMVPKGASSLREVLSATARWPSRRHLPEEGPREPISPQHTLREWIAAPPLRVLGQRIVDMHSGSTEGRELLVRGERAASHAPQALFDTAKNHGLAEALDLHCLKTSLAARADLPDVRHHINVLPSTLTGPRRRELEQLVAQRHAVGPLCIEVSEHEIVGNPEPLRESRDVLRDQGVAFALDNASFSRNTLEALMVLKPDFVKVDGSLMGDRARRAGRARDLKRLVTAAQTLGIDVIAQCVESEGDAATLVGLGIKTGQGFLWEAPVDVQTLSSPPLAHDAVTCGTGRVR